ncbi:hypothetical protein JFU47_19500 [Pseudomonas sp. TH39(2020)]|uniref:hypothetical protein n=1 Tax=Pseudomonas sp. TH39(2020) TaxID=2796349 RepID=UPI001913566D|nr:hypothetical protein [Pseudomonas sp. TH39(2020)]MBK5398881.1 hypothetical protein [Pseudomonas sp. TH39(2020)]
MGSLNGTFYGAYGDNQIYLSITHSDDITGEIRGTLSNYGSTSTVNGSYTMTQQFAQIFLNTWGPSTEQWSLITYDYNTLSGTRNIMGPTGVTQQQIAGLGRV